MPSVSMRQLLEAGVHFGHQTRRWNPKMRPFIFAERNGIHIIDLAQTVKRLDAALQFVTETAARGDGVLFVGTKKQAQEPIAEEATRAGMPYVNQRWLGGMLTNFVTIRKRLGLLDQLEARQANGDFERMTKKEASRLTDEMARLQRTLGGMRKMKRLPGAVFVVDPHREHIAPSRRASWRSRSSAPATRTSTRTSSTTSSPPTTTPSAPSACSAAWSPRRPSRAPGSVPPAPRPSSSSRKRSRSRPSRPGGDASDELVAQLRAGGTLTFAPEPEEDETALLPVHGRPIEAHPHRPAEGEAAAEA